MNECERRIIAAKDATAGKSYDDLVIAANSVIDRTPKSLTEIQHISSAAVDLLSSIIEYRNYYGLPSDGTCHMCNGDRCSRGFNYKKTPEPVGSWFLGIHDMDRLFVKNVPPSSRLTYTMERLSTMIKNFDTHKSHDPHQVGAIVSCYTNLETIYKYAPLGTLAPEVDLFVRALRGEKIISPIRRSFLDSKI